MITKYYDEHIILNIYVNNEYILYIYILKLIFM